MGKYVIIGIVFFMVLIAAIGYIDNRRIVNAMIRITNCPELEQEGRNQFSCGDELYRIERLENFNEEHMLYEHVIDTLGNTWVVLKAD